MRDRWLAGLVMASGLSLACDAGPKSSRGFRLPDGDPGHGRAVFVANRCQTCHEVAGEDFPAPVAEPPVRVRLGGPVHGVISDGELVTSIISPSHRVSARYELAAVQSGKLSRMGDFTEALSVRDLRDLVAYLRTRYTVVAPPVYYK
jgi:mono/diheme cytochrome c family protein